MTGAVIASRREPAWRSRRLGRSSAWIAAGLPRTLRVLAMTTLFAACASPEAGRKPGHPGADVKNWGQPVELHAGAQPYHDTPCVTDKVECHGPLPVFGTHPPPD
jgi:hypothetical protein